MIKLIGITGKARAGKDTLAKCYVDLGYEQMAFAAGVKIVTAHIAGESEDLYYDDNTKDEFCPNLGMTRRRAMQNIGNAMRDAIGPDVWISPVLGQWRSKGCFNTVISDVRYPNEAKAIREAGGIIIHVVRPASEGLTGEAADHISEAGIPPELVNYVLLNNSTKRMMAYEAAHILTLGA